MSSNSPTPRTKPQPVIILGALVAALTFAIDSLQAIFKDNPTVVLVLSVVGVLVAAAALFKDRYVRDSVVPLQDTATYINEAGETVAGPASPLPDGTVVSDVSQGELLTAVADRLEALRSGELGVQTPTTIGEEPKSKGGGV